MPLSRFFAAVIACLVLFTARRLGLKVAYEKVWAETRSFRTLDMVLLSAIPQFRSLTYTFDEKRLLEFYRFVYLHSSIVRENDSAAVYRSLQDRFKGDCKYDVLLKANDCLLYLPLLVSSKKLAVLIYRDDLFLNDLSIQQLPNNQFKYSLLQSSALNIFYETLEASLEAAGLTVARLHTCDDIDEQLEHYLAATI